jgi:hypothetical protein
MKETKMRLNRVLSEFTKSGVQFFRISSVNEVLLFIYLFFYGYLFLNYRALSMDEITNFNLSRNFSFFQTNAPPGDTGALFWTLLGFFPNFATARLFFFILLIISICIIVEIKNEDENKSLFLTVLYLTMPFAFWTGKLISPEILLFFLVAISIKIFTRYEKTAFIIVGIAIGIKLTALPALVYIFLSGFKKSVIIKKTKFVFFCILVFTITNIFSLKRLIQSLLLSDEKEITHDGYLKIKSILFGNLQSWDSIQFGSLGHFIFHPVLIAGILLVGMFYQLKSTVTFLCVFLATTILIWVSPAGFGWYWFPFIPILFKYVSEIFAEIRASAKSKTILYLFCFLLPTTNAIYNISTIHASISEKTQQIQTINNVDKVCLKAFFGSNSQKKIYAVADFGLNLEIPNKDGVNIYYGQFEIIKSNMDSGIIVISNRLMGNEYFLKSLIESKRSVIIKKQCDSIFILEVI